ncbi:glycosyltransferase [Microbacterium aurum]
MTVELIRETEGRVRPRRNMSATSRDVRQTPSIALAHDYITQRGGAERVVLSIERAFRGAPVHTSLYEPRTTFPDFAALDIQPMRLNRFTVLRHNHRLALPFLAREVTRHRVDAEVLLASSSGWAHGIPTTGRKIVYCHAPARWLYQTDRYAGVPGENGSRGLRRRLVTLADVALGRHLREWDHAAALTADRYLVNSTVIQHAVREVYDIEAEVVAPPPATFTRSGPARPMRAVEGKRFVLCVARLLPYKNVHHVIEAVSGLDDVELVIVGDGPERARLETLAARVGGTHLSGRVEDAELRWLYENCAGLVAASYEDFGLSPVEAAAFGKPTAALHAGGYLDTVVGGQTGIFFEEPTRESIGEAVAIMLDTRWSEQAILAQAEKFCESRFIARLQNIVEEERARA